MPQPRFLIIGLAPGLHGANRTGRPFTGDWAGDLLFATLLELKAWRPASIDERPDDGLDADRLPHRQRRALCAAAEQADTGRDQAPATRS